MILESLEWTAPESPLPPPSTPSKSSPWPSYADTLKKTPPRVNNVGKKDAGFRVADRRGKAAKAGSASQEACERKSAGSSSSATSRGGQSVDLYVAANKMTAAINIALHQTGAPAHVRVQVVTVSRRGILHTVAGPKADAKMVLRFKEAILKAVRAIDPGVCEKNRQ